MFKQFSLPCCHDPCDCCLTEAEKTSRDIERELLRMHIRDLYVGKVLLLGNGEAGKSTFLKQMKIQRDGGIKIQEKIRLIPFINLQILNNIRIIIQAMQTLSISFENPRNEKYVYILNLPNNNNNIPRLSARTIEAIKRMWLDNGVKTCYHRRREYQLTDSAKYFFDSIDRISKNDYIPTDDDILRVRIPTTSIVQEDFHFSPYHVQIIDVGGQKTERRKWIYCFDNVTTIIFLASLIEYDQYVPNDPSKQNLMMESLALFRVILEADYFTNASVILFLNKIDLFPERLADKPLRDTFPDYDGADDDVEAAKEFIKNKYLSVIPTTEDKKRIVFPHFTCSVDSENIQIIFNEIKERIFEDIMIAIFGA